VATAVHRIPCGINLLLVDNGRLNITAYNTTAVPRRPIKALLVVVLGRLLHPFDSLFSRITWISRYWIGKTSLGLNEARDDWGFGMQWH